jgi:hypothetical protein
MLGTKFAVGLDEVAGTIGGELAGKLVGGLTGGVGINYLIYSLNLEAGIPNLTLCLYPECSIATLAPQSISLMEGLDVRRA